MTALFVTSSGTDIGKTHVSAILCRQLVAKGRSVLPLKPVLSGFDEADVAGSDSGILLEAVGRAATLDQVRAITPWRFEAPLSPDMAAKREGREIAFQPVMDFLKQEIETAEDAVLIEGAGGVLAPLNDTSRMVDIPRVLQTPALLVVDSYLGTISHSLTAVESLDRHGIELAGLIVSQSEESPVPLEETLEALQRFAPEVPMGALPRVSLQDWQSAPDLTFLLPD